MASNIERSILTIIEPTIVLDELVIADAESATPDSVTPNTQIANSKIYNITPLVRINQYEVNGKLIQKVGTDVPDEVYQASLVKSVEIDGKEVHPQIAKQFQQVFLIDLPPSTLASALSNVELI